MERLILVAAIGSGGAAGALLRGFISDYLKARTDNDLFWLGTLVVNLTGCFLIGFFSLVSARSTETSPLLWKFLITGFLGALTTFSTFALDLCLLLRDSRPATALLVAGSHLIPGVLLVFAGMKVAEILNTTPP